MSLPEEVPLTGSGREAKREAILEAARTVFLEVGFGAASMDSIATVAKVSKQTVYNHFGSKEELFAAMIRSFVEQKIRVFSKVAEGGKPAETLSAIAHQFLDPDNAGPRLALYRILMGEAPRFPELGDIYYDAGPAVVRKFLTDYLAEQDARGTLKVENPKFAAELFYGMLNGCQYKAQLGIERMPDKRTVDAYVDYAVGVMMRAFAVGPRN